MVLSSLDYQAQLRALLPPGPAWPSDDDTTTGKLLGGLALELARIDGRAWQLLEEVDPRTSAELFLDWRRVAGLPDACVEAFAGTQTDDQLRIALLGRITAVGGQSLSYFTEVAAAQGYAITITEFRAHNVDDDVEYLIYGVAWNFAWQINAALNSVIEATADSTVDEPLASWGNSLLECVIDRLKPAHTTTIYSYT